MERYSSGSGVEVCFPKKWYENAPQCAHGPMLLFQRFVKGKQDGQRFYACSACRNRKQCSAFLHENDFLRKSRAKQEGNFVIRSGKTEIAAWPITNYRLPDLLKINYSERAFCQNCQIVQRKKDVTRANHCCENDKIKIEISDYDILHPSRNILSPLLNDKKNAQYFLNQSTSSFLLHTLVKLEFTHVVCIGMPTLHEAIQAPKYMPSTAVSDLLTKQMDSILLDIDCRYVQFTDRERFCHFNMFNRHFFKGYISIFKKFIESGCKAERSKFVIVLDPPFGGLVDAIAETLKWLSEVICELSQTNIEGNDLIPILWIFPYFMEKRISVSFPNSTMLDYQVNYENHAKFRRKKTSCRISPVRLFTNIARNRIVLPQSEGYRFCATCDRYVSSGNVHCQKCRACTSKDGRTYAHCDKCGFCVKPGRRHCEFCGRCELSDHVCRSAEAIDLGCHQCGKLTHKRRDCPVVKAAKWNSSGNSCSFQPTAEVPTSDSPDVGIGKPPTKRRKCD